MYPGSLARTCAFAALLSCALLPTALGAQFDTTQWELSGDSARVVHHLGRQALALQNGIAVWRGAPLENGTIEFDIAVENTFGFAGVHFRMTDDRNYEHWYIRPFVSGNPDATQYEPVTLGNTGWQIYVGDRYTAPLRFRFGEWMHVRIAFEGTRAAVYLDADSVPSQYIPVLLRGPVAGTVALSTSLTTAHFSNVRVTPGIVRPLPQRDVPATPAPPGIVTTWSISNPVAEARLASAAELPRDLVAALTWRTAAPTERGIVNLGPFASRDAEQNTVFAALTLTADSPRVQRIRFGFSDRVRVYLNGRLLYTGNDGYRTRDYRFLGTVGLFDELALPLETGANEVWFAVSESFGGWAVTAALEPEPGVRVAAGGAPLRARD